MISISLHKKLDGAEGILDLLFETKIKEGELVTLYGASGAGKTSVFRMLSGLLQPVSGRVEIDGRVWFDSEKKINLRPQERNVGMVFQDYSLFPNMTVQENLEFALEKREPNSIINELLELTELGQLAKKKPAQLSGGQKQRVALARALVRKPKLLLLDEPLSALDIEMQTKIQDYIVLLHREFKLTTLLISHDLMEIIKMSDRVLFLKEGKIKKDGSPKDVLPLTTLKDFFKSNYLTVK
ncbi:ABC transporter ATP-binding protein [Algoriphagus sp.]|uniref:ABC transporter ATP-binding protein n=1 Tax=Algoriphagus sp. TaxID=1872435 RepID=UPI003919BFC8